MFLSYRYTIGTGCLKQGIVNMLFFPNQFYSTFQHTLHHLKVVVLLYIPLILPTYLKVSYY